MDLVTRIDRWAATAPDRLAHVSWDRRLSYAELRRRSDALAAHLAATLPDDGAPVAVLGHKEPELLVGFLGAVKAGHPYVPLDTALPPARIERIQALAGARLLLTPEAIAARSAGDAPVPRRRRDAGDPHYVIFTSGSTGEPKGVVITLGGLTAFVDWMLDEHRFTEKAELFLNQAPFSFDLSVMDLYPCLTTGGTLISVSATDVANPRRLFAVLAGSGLTTWVSTPSFARLCLAEPSFDEGMIPTLGRFLFCGETLAPAVAGQLLDRFPQAQVWNTYGPTETTVATTSVRIDRQVLARYAPLPVGRPMPGTRVLVVGDDGRPLPPGERGEIVVAGPNVSTGYLGRPDLTAEAFFGLEGMRAYRTGDLGVYRDGLLFFEGRRDDQVKLHGHRIELGDVESHLRALPGVRDAAVVPILRDGVPDVLLAAIIPVGALPASELEAGLALRRRLGERLPAYMVPRVVRFVAALPMTPNGKVDRRRLADSLA
jgi:D-alanine--poly(phosphoribitol) ligase subunit 1